MKYSQRLKEAEDRARITSDMKTLLNELHEQIELRDKFISEQKKYISTLEGYVKDLKHALGEDYL